MPLAPFFNLMWYGSASAAMSVEVAMPTNQLSMKQNKRMSLDVAVVLPAAYLYAQRGKNGLLNVQIVAQIHTLIMQKRLKAVLDVAINKLSQDDVTGAVLDVEIEPGISLRSAMKLLLAINAGKTSITDVGGGNVEVVFRNILDTKDTLTATTNGGQRTSIDLDI
jgi:C-terminal processing protease CtpA/Prc